MGGDRETIIEKSSCLGTGNKIGKIDLLRIHENDREVHFHDDIEQLKVAIPVSEWFDLWLKFSCQNIKKLVYLDVKNSTQLTLKMKFSQNLTNPKILDQKIVAKVQKVNLSPEFSSLYNFTTGN